ncbi:hypothetical protein NE584_08450 [Clostridium sp. DFI.5.61]|uniref:hypothetical protein n=1 Tax=Clostridium sp. DFI.5.61 TaxID=2965279 RepID=UPI00210B8FD8|nr:hypothetical protein [Clostridium sp. DFI.5.61]MCB5926004.1 hypothetical protein [bacterium 210820-DFI.5.26]MCQ5159066.1 hypothetical protein [Clostridium sp. DFI.5.61]
MSAFVPEVQAQAKAASLLLLQIVREYFTDPVHRAEFEDWYRKKTGEEYVWKKVIDE